MLYIKLFHGRKNTNESLDDWGSEGPIFGPYVYIHTTYVRHIKMGMNPDCVDELFTTDDLIYYDGVYYGDWRVFTDDVMKKEDSSLMQKYDHQKAELPSRKIICKEDSVKFIVYIKGGTCHDVKCNLPSDLWQYALVNYDNNPHLPDDYSPFP